MSEEGDIVEVEKEVKKGLFIPEYYKANSLIFENEYEKAEDILKKYDFCPIA
jgi:hypothetical protein